MSGHWNTVMVSKYMYTDGSKDQDGLVGFGFVSHAENTALVTKQCGQLNEEAIVFQAKTHALQEAVAWLLDKHGGCPITLYTDSQAAFNYIANPI